MPPFNPQNRNPIRHGFVPLSDCAPLAVAKQTGLFERYGVDVDLVCLPDWATVRDMLFFGELDAAEAIAKLAFSLTLGIGHLKRDVCVPLILSGQGNAITLSKQIPHEFIGSGAGLAAYIAHRWKESSPITPAAAHRYSSHHLLLQSWLKQHGMRPGTDVELVFNTGIDTQDASSFHLFHGSALNPPTPDKASWFLVGMRSADLLPDSIAGSSLTRIYRHNLFRAASELMLPA